MRREHVAYQSSHSAVKSGPHVPPERKGTFLSHLILTETGVEQIGGRILAPSFSLSARCEIPLHCRFRSLPVRLPGKPSPT